jgi:hypothetical protein
MRAYRIEHRTGGDVVVVGYSDAADARQAELSECAADLTISGATGELVLVDVAHREDVARRYLRPEWERTVPRASGS